MEKKIEDYLHLYLGADYQWRDGDGEWRRPQRLNTYNLNDINRYMNTDDVRLILRPLSDMTEEEKVRVALWEFTNYKSAELTPNISDNDFFTFRNENGMKCSVNIHYLSAETTRKLLKAGFDLFGLIDSGLAIDATISPTKPTTHVNK